MSEPVEVPFEDNPTDQAVLLLAAAQELGLEQSVVQTGSRVFIVPEEVRDKAFSTEPEKKNAPAKKAPAKKAAAKKSTTNKTQE